MAVNFITENPVARGWDQQQARTDAAVASGLRAAQTGEAIDQMRQRRAEADAMGQALNGQQPGADTLDVMRDLSQRPGLLPATRLNLMHSIAQIEQSRAAAARAQAAQDSTDQWRRDRIRISEDGERRRGAAGEPMLPVQNPDGTTAYVPRSQAAGQTPATRGGEPMVITRGPNGEAVYTPRSQAAGQAAAPRPQAQNGPYQGNSMDAQDSNILLNGDPASPEYAMAYQRQSRPRQQQVPSDPNNPNSPLMLAEIRPDMSHVRPPTYRAPSAGAAPAPAAAPPADGAAPPAPQSDGPGAPAAPTASPAAPTQAAPQQGPTVQRIQGTTRPGTAVPPAAMTAMTRNVTAMGNIDRALNALNRHPNAVGLMPGIAAGSGGWIGQSIWDRADPQGVEARAALANIGSMVIHDRTGAAMSVAEEARLRPFIPHVGDSAETIRVKLQGLRDFALNELRAQYGNYGQAQGYRPLPEVERAIGNGAQPAPTTPSYRIENGRLVPNQRSDAGGRPEQLAQAPGARALTGNGMADAGQASLENRRVDSQWNSGGVLVGPDGQPATPGTRDNPAVLPNGAAPATGPASDFGDGMDGDRAQVPAPYRTAASPTQPPAGPQPTPAAPRGRQALYGPNYVDTLFRQEGSGVNPRSSAAGYGQFLEGTWLGRPDAPGIVARLVANNPNAQAVLQRAWAGDAQARQQLLALRSDPQVARAAVGEYVRQTAGAFRNAGIEVNDTNLALAHFLGPAGATRFLRAVQADPNMPVTRIMPAAVLRANPEVLMPGGQPITAGALYAQYARRYGGGAGGPAMPSSSDPSMGSNPDQNPGIAPLSAPAPQVPAVPSLAEMPPAPGPGASPAPQVAAPPPGAPPTSTPPTPTAATEIDSRAPGVSSVAPLATETGARLDAASAAPPAAPSPRQMSANPFLDSFMGRRSFDAQPGGPLDGHVSILGAAPGAAGMPDQAQGDAPLAPPNGGSAGSPVSTGRREPTAQERLAADLRQVVGRMPTAGPPQGPFALTDPATIREARDRFAQGGRTADWNAGVTSFLEDRFGRAMEQSSTPHDFQRAVFASPRDRALMMATLTPEQQTAFRDLIRVTDLASRNGAPGPIAQLAQGIYAGRSAGTLARLITDPEAVAQMRILNQIAPDSPRALQVVNTILGRLAAPPEAAPMAGPAVPAPRAVPRFRIQGGQLVPVTE